MRSWRNQTLALLLFSSFSYATLYTVGSGKTYTNIAACAAVAKGGDTCDIYTGTYAGWTQAANGSAGNLITFQAHAGETVSVSSSVTINGVSYVHITGLHFTGTGMDSGIYGNGTSAHNVIDYNTFVDTAYRPTSGYPSASDSVISHNTVNFSTKTSSRPGFSVFGDRNLLEYNEIYNGGGDCFHLSGTNVVLRLNNCHDEDATTSGEHIDFMQEGGGAPLLTYSLIENNTEHNCVDPTDNCHFVFMRTSPTSGNATNNIVRFNFAQNLNGGGSGFGGPGDSVPNTYVYNNTMAIEHVQASNGTCLMFQIGAPNSASRNNICYNSTSGYWSPTYNGDIGHTGNGDIAYTTAWGGSWGSPYSSEATYATLKNVDPNFANYPTDATLSAGSGAIGTGVALTTVASGDSGSGTSLVVNDAGFFQSYASSADCVSVTTVSNHVCITAIDYGTNTITLASGVSRSHGDSVWLYSDSTGRQVLFGTAPNVGAGFDPGSQPAPPTGLAAVVH